MRRRIIIPIVLGALAITACGAQGGAEPREAPAAAPAVTTPPTMAKAPVETAPPAPVEAPTTTAPPTTTSPPPPAPEPVHVDVNITNEATDVIVPEGPVVVAPPAPPVVVAPPPVYVAPAPPPVVYDRTRIAPGVIEDGVHYGYLYGWSMGDFSFDRADVAADGTWSNTNPKVRTLTIGYWPFDTAPEHLWSGESIEVHVQNQHVVAVYVLDGYGACGC